MNSWDPRPAAPRQVYVFLLLWLRWVPAGDLGGSHQLLSLARAAWPGQRRMWGWLAERLSESPGVRQPESGWEGSPGGRGFHSVMESRGKRKCVLCPFDTLTLCEPGPQAPSPQLQMPQSPEDTARVSAYTCPQGGGIGRTLGSLPSCLTSPLCQLCPGARVGS